MADVFADKTYYKVLVNPISKWMKCTYEYDSVFSHY